MSCFAAHISTPHNCAFSPCPTLSAFCTIWATGYGILAQSSPEAGGSGEKWTVTLFTPLKVWGDPSSKTAFTIELYPIHAPYLHLPSESVVVYADSFDEAVLIARRQALPLNLEPRRREAKRLN